MKTQIANTLVLVVAVIVGSIAFTQDAAAQERLVVDPGGQAEVYVRPIQQNPFYFGMNVELKRTRWGGTTLRVVGVTPGSPAHQAGLEIGDEIRQVNGRSFRNASDSFDAVRMLNRYVANAGIGGTAPAADAGVNALVISPPQVSAIAHMIVRNVRNGRNVSLNVYPNRVGGGIQTAPAVTAGS